LLVCVPMAAWAQDEGMPSWADRDFSGVEYRTQENTSVLRFRETRVFADPGTIAPVALALRARESRENALPPVVVRKPVVPPADADQGEDRTPLRQQAAVSKVAIDPMIENEPAVTALVRKHLTFLAKTKDRPGYRVQLYTGPSREEAADMRVRFLERYNGDMYLLYDKPHYRLRVGNFIRQSDADVYAEYIKKPFPNAIVVRDNNLELPRR
jgi:hypothetical protein